jgi:hypothetical protein
MLRASKVLDMPHRVMHGPNLLFKVRQQIELIHDKHLGVLLKEFKLRSVHTTM